MEEELKQLEKEEQELETQHQLLKQDYKGESEGAAQCWRAFRDKQRFFVGRIHFIVSLRHLLDISESSQRIDAELRYIERQHNRLASTNVLDLAFHIWVDVEAGGTIRKFYFLRSYGAIFTNQFSGNQWTSSWKITRKGKPSGVVRTQRCLWASSPPFGCKSLPICTRHFRLRFLCSEQM